MQTSHENEALNALLIVVYDRAFARTTISLLLLGSKLDKTGIGSRCGSQLATTEYSFFCELDPVYSGLILQERNKKVAT